MKKQEILNYLDEELMDKLFGYCYARTSDSYEAQELSSDIIYALVKTARSEGEISNLYPFIWKVARNVYADFIKQKKQRQEVFHAGNPEDVFALLSDEEDDKSREQLETVYRQIAFLTKIYREVMILFYIDGLSTAEIAEIQNVSETAVRQRLFCARQKIKDEVQDMEKVSERPLALDQIDFDLWGDGAPDWGDPRELAVRTLSRHIIWLCREKPMGAAEIAQKLNVPTFYIEEELELLVSGKNGTYGLLRREGNDRYVINFVLLDETTMKKAMRIYAEQMPKVCRIITDYVVEHREEYLEVPYLNHCFGNEKQDFNLVLWQQMFAVVGAFRDKVDRILAEKHFAAYEKLERPFSVYGYVDTGVSYGMGKDRVYAQNLCGYKFVWIDNIYASFINRHFSYGHNISQDSQLQMALRAVDGLAINSLTEDEKEHAAKAVECGYLEKEGDMLYTKILVCPMEKEEQMFAVSERLSEGYFEQEAQEVADQIGALIKKAVPRHLLGDWMFFNRLAGMQVAEFVVKELIEQGILTPPKDGIGAEGCWMSVYR